MPQPESAPPAATTVFQRLCPKCGAQMRLTQIVPEIEDGSDRRFFECPDCQHSEDEVVKFWPN
jgi:DNA-directed RNA polymerase subunit M/transcription elongation factor TFIIS